MDLNNFSQKLKSRDKINFIQRKMKCKYEEDCLFLAFSRSCLYFLNKGNYR